MDFARMECKIHVVEDCVDALQCRSVVSLEKIKFCTDQWILTDEKETKVAAQLTAFFCEDNSQQSISHHRRCYMRFTDKRKIIAAIKRKQNRKDNDSLDSEENSNKILKRQMRNNTLATPITKLQCSELC
ncbi:hypothetical protein AVEN_14052-1 [Araneus ventricosus]|uniref:Uncharacterized protein n=1 Tax=Araneus ventricosus TaxID=182803 RepID=A0A4Y2PIS6_ARAVE|nr:hypothetical protein AVEN_14052-1 [Araneus ventricosus]